MDFRNANKLIISLPKREDRRNKMQLRLLGTHTFVEAVDGFQLPYDGKMPLPTGKYHLTLPIDQRERIAMSQAACRMSHANCIQIAKDNKWPYVIIIEDDAEFDPTINEKIAEYSKEVPQDWQQLYFGAHHFRTPDMISERVGRCVTALSTICYAVRDTSYDTFLQALMADEVLDIIYCNHLHTKANLPAYAFYPNLVVQRKGFSDIEQMEVNYDRYYRK